MTSTSLSKRPKGKPYKNRPSLKTDSLSHSRKYGQRIKILLKKYKKTTKQILGLKLYRKSPLNEKRKMSKKLHYQAEEHVVAQQISPK